jgi:CDP-glucose 4,6-dehydratase
VENLVSGMQDYLGAFRGKRVLVTGHTGFKGSWLCEWLLLLGADVHGLALEPETDPALFTQLGLAGRLTHRIGDVRDLATVRDIVCAADPHYVFHLAAQPLVRHSYRDPVLTYGTNVMGTVHLLEALRELKSPCAAVLVTTDKCYENREWVWGYREDDALGGHDPYSSSKGMAELAIAAYRRSFFEGGMLRAASGRAGNVIGGGDWAADRIVPDCIRALVSNRPIPVRNRLATRPWQHVLEPLSGYLWLAARLAAEGGESLATAFNFGPSKHSNRSVARLVEEILSHWPGSWDDQTDPRAVHEATQLHLNTDKALARLEWHPVWNFADTIRETVHWYHSVHGGADPLSLTRTQIGTYQQAAGALGVAWAA